MNMKPTLTYNELNAKHQRNHKAKLNSTLATIFIVIVSF